MSTQFVGYIIRPHLPDLARIGVHSEQRKATSSSSQVRSWIV
ncbi:hypothetical protein PspLS_05266 [Pyricularia sp. CBS 133598]|nr:hypothetical protein PspLS_05266 [Pyricularia sp. CBS 133598]